MSKNDDLVRRLECPKCGAISGDDWAQCEGNCPMPGSPHYAADVIERGAAQGVREIDLSKAVKSEHPDIVANDKQYLVKICGGWFFGRFTRQWYGLSFSNWGTSGCQFDAPGYNSSRWERVIEIDPEAIATPPAPTSDAGETLVDQMPDAFFDEDHSDENPTVRDVDELIDPTPQSPAVEAGEVRRFDIEHDPDIGEIRRLRPDGKLVDYRDHEAALKAKTDEIERLRRELSASDSLGTAWFEAHLAHRKALDALGAANGELLKRAMDAESRAEAAEASNKALREIVPDLGHVISWLENGCDRQAAAQELRIYQSRARALLSEKGGE